MENNLWICESCGRKFKYRHQQHTCGKFSVKNLLKGNNPRAILLYERFEELVKRCGPVSIEPTKTRICFKTDTVFTAVNVNKYGLNVSLILHKKLESPRFINIFKASPGKHIHHLKITSLDGLDDEVKSWLKDAYAESRE